MKGHGFDLEELSDHFRSPERNVSKDEDGYYYLRSSSFDSLPDDTAVRERALELLEHMNGAAMFYSGGSYQPVEFDGISRMDEQGKRHQFVYLSASIEGRSRMSADLRHQAR